MLLLGGFHLGLDRFQPARGGVPRGRTVTRSISGIDRTGGGKARGDDNQHEPMAACFHLAVMQPHLAGLCRNGHIRILDHIPIPCDRISDASAVRGPTYNRPVTLWPVYLKSMGATGGSSVPPVPMPLGGEGRHWRVKAPASGTRTTMLE